MARIEKNTKTEFHIADDFMDFEATFTGEKVCLSGDLSWGGIALSTHQLRELRNWSQARLNEIEGKTIGDQSCHRNKT